MGEYTTSFDRSRLKDIPKSPGIYIMRDKDGEVIYVGKAINLRNRVRSYFQDSKNLSVKTRSLVSHIADIETIVVDNELEALILECNHIKRYRPKYNIDLKDGKTYPYIVVTLSENYPRVLLTREKHKDENRYFGPYTSVYAVRKTIEAINRRFPLKLCNKPAAPGEKVSRPCLNYHIGKCPAPCTGEIDQEHYNKQIEQIIKVLDGKADDLVADIKKQMLEASSKLDFETAAELRDQIEAIEHINERQLMIKQGGHDQDIIALYKDHDLACMQVLNIRAGQLVGRDTLYGEDILEESEEDIITAFTKQYYTGGAYIPSEIVFEEELPENLLTEISMLLDFESEKRIKLTHPKRGEKRRLAEMALENAKVSLEQKEALEMRKAELSSGKMEALQELLNLDKLPVNIEAYDISNISGSNNVGGMVVFRETKPDKKSYRRFKIKDVEGQDDYASMQEMIFRRIERGLEEQAAGKNKSSFLPFPEVFAIDGGKTHVHLVEQILSLYPELDIAVIGLVKDDHHRIRGVVYKDREYPLKYATPLSRFLSDISEEVHRYAISYHKSLRKKSMLESELEDIPGIGKKRRELLMRHFGNLKNIKSASIEEIAALKGMSQKTAKTVHDYFTGERKNG